MRKGAIMDSEIAGAVSSVDLDRASAYTWFETIAGVRRKSGAEWAAFAEGVMAAGVIPSGQAENFLRHVEDNGGMDLIDRLASAGADELMSVYDQLHATESAAEAPVDYWSASVSAYGGDWATFDGSEQSWVAHRDRFYANANAYHPAAYAVAYDRLSPLDRAPMPERIAALQGFGFPVTATGRPAVGSEDSWTTLVAAHGGDWATFDGSEPSWATVRDQFYRNANALDPRLYALAYQRLNGLEGRPMAQRIAALREAGLPVLAQPAADQPGTEDRAEVQDGTGMTDEQAAKVLEQAMLDAIG